MPERTPNRVEGLALVRAEMHDIARFIVGHQVNTACQFDLETEAWQIVRDYGKDHPMLDLPDPFDAMDDCQLLPLLPQQNTLYQRFPYLLHRDSQGRIVHLLQYHDNMPAPTVDSNFELTIPLR